jgi:hypothetical protein
LLLLASVSAGCGFSADFSGTSYQCGEGDRCPSGYMCVNDTCVSSPGGGDGGVDAMGDGSVPEGGCGKLTLLRDDFSSNGVSGYPWEMFNDADVMVTQTGGELVLTLIGGGGVNEYGGYKSVAYYDLRDSEIQAKVDAVGGHDTILEIRNEQDQKVQMVVEDGDLTPAILNAPAGGALPTIPYDAVAMAYWRLRESTGHMYWEYSADRTSWQLLYDQTDPFDVGFVQGVVAAGAPLASTTTARFADVNVQASGGAFCKAETLSDSFGLDFLPNFDHWSANGCTISVGNGDLISTFDGLENNCFTGINTTRRYDLRGSQIVVDAEQIPVAAHFITYLGVYDERVPNKQTNLEIGLDFGDGTGTPTMYFDETDRDSTVASSSAMWNPAEMRYWRLRESGGHLLVDTSPDAANWTNRFDAAAQIDVSQVRFEIGMGNYATTTAPQTVKFGSVN